MEFNDFRQRFQAHIADLVNNQQMLFVTNVEKQLMWDTYLNAFPDELKQEYNCNCCRSFIRQWGNVVALKDGKIHSIWSFISDEPFTEVCKAMNTLITSAPISDVFVTKHPKLGTEKNVQGYITDENGKQVRLETTLTWWHLYFQLPKMLVTSSSKSEEAIMGEFRDLRNVFKRSLDEISIDAVDTILELIAQNSLYRGAEFKGMLNAFKKIKVAYALIPDNERDIYCWLNFNQHSGSVAKIRNTSIGTLLMDISEGKELDNAVAAFERIMAPANYKRPNAIITTKMVEQAESTIAELGLTNSLGRRFAIIDDITANNVLFVDRDVKAKKASTGLGALKEDLPINPKQFSKVESIAVSDFIKNVLPLSTNVEVLLENQHISNLVSLIAPQDTKAPSLFKWDNGFSWAYKNSLADSMKEKVKAAGGSIDGVLRFTIQWNDEDTKGVLDFDAEAYEPDGNHIYFSNNKKPGRSRLGGQLDVDMIRPNSIGIENITWDTLGKMQQGVYKLAIRNYDSGHNTGFKAEVEFNGEIHSFYYPKKVMGEMEIAHVTLSKEGFSIQPKIESSNSVSSKQVWGIDTSKFHKVNLICYSPNYWNDKPVGNQHVFFSLANANNDEITRGFFNEFLNSELDKHKRVFEALGSKMKVDPAINQVSGLGFSTTQRNELIVKVTGKTERMLKLQF